MKCLPRMIRLLSMVVFPAVVSMTTAQEQSRYSMVASLANPRIAVGEVGALELKAIGGEPDSYPRSIDVPGLRVTYTGSQFHEDSTVTDNQISLRLVYTYYYTIEALAEGEYTIPSISTTIKGVQVASEPLTIRVGKSESGSVNPTGSKFARLTVPEEELFVNQLFPVDANIYVLGRNSINGVSDAELTHESFVIRRFEQLDIGAVELKGDVYSTARLPTRLFALKAGDHRLGPAAFKVKLYESNTRFPSLFTQLKIRSVSSDTVRLKVLPLPAGAPESFSGGVGAFEMESTISPRNLKVGDPISLEFEVFGTGNLETMGAPIIPGLDRKTWKTYDAKKDVKTDSDGINPGRVLFSQILIPLKEVDEVPSFELTFFDPEHRQYVTRRSLPVQITVIPDNRPVPQMGGEPVGFAGQEIGYPVAPAVGPTAQYPDILHIRPGIPRLTPYSGTGTGVFLTITNSLLAILFLGLAGFGVMRRLRARNAGRMLTPKPQTFRELAPSVKAGLNRGDFFHRALHAFTLFEEENRGVPRDISDLVATLKGACEQALYSGGQQKLDDPVTPEESREIIKVVRKLSSK